MKTLFLTRCAFFFASLFLSTHAQSQYGPYTVNYPSGPPPTNQPSSGSIGFEVPIERTGHGFSFQWRTVANGSISSGSTYPTRFVTSSGTGASAVLRSFLVMAATPSSYVSTPYTYTSNGTTYTSYYYSSVPFSCVEWWLVDTAANQSTPHYAGTPSQNVDLRTATWSQLGGGVTNRYFAIPEARFGHALVAGSVQSGWTPVTSGYIKFGTYSNGTSGTQVPPTFFIGSTPAGAGDFSLADRSDGKKALLNQTNVIASTWEHDYGIYPMEAVTLYLPAVETRYRYVLRWNLPNQPQGASSLMPGTQEAALSTSTVNAGTQSIPAGAARIIGTVPIGASFWLTRSIDTYETPIFTLTPALAAASTPKVWWVVNTPPTIAWTPVTFGIRGSTARLAQDFTISQPSSFSPTTPNVSENRPLMQIEDYLVGGQSNTFEYFTVTGMINPAEAASLLGDGNAVNATLERWVYDGWTWVGGQPLPAPPAAPGTYSFSFSLKGPRASFPALRLTSPDELVISSYESLLIDAAVSSPDFWHPERTWAQPQATVVFSTAYTGPTGVWLLSDLAGNDPAPQALNVGNFANYAHDFGYWPPQPRPLALKISGSRWTSDNLQRLWLRQSDSGPAVPVTPTSSVQWISADPTGTVWTSPAYQFDATANVREGVPYWIYDEETGEESPLPLSRTNLTAWFALPTPGGLTGSINTQAGTADLSWPLGVAAHEGGFDIERHRTGDPTFQTIGTIASSTVDAGNMLHFPDLNLTPGKIHSYRVRYAFGAGADRRRSARSNPIVLVGWSDADADGLPDAWESFWGLNPNSSADAAIDLDGDGHTNAEEFVARTDPTDFYNGASPAISLISGNRQVGSLGAVLGDPLVVSVKVLGVPQINAPVTFTATGGIGTISATGTGSGQIQTVIRTDSQGRATAFLRLAATHYSGGEVTASTGNAAAEVRVTFKQYYLNLTQAEISYDAEGRLLNASGSSPFQYSYDAEGNIGSQP